MLYEADACFVPQPGEPAKSPKSVRESLRNFIDLKGKLDLKVKRVLQASDLALEITEWSYSVTGPMVILLIWLPNLLTFCVIKPMELGDLS
jgi:hypothetical protein